MLKRINPPDIELLRLLIDNSRQSYLELSKKLGIHKDTVRKRVKLLVDQKIIDRFTISVNQDKLAELYPNILRVFFTIKMLRNHDSMVQELLNHKSVIELEEATPAAVHDILIHAQFKNLLEFNEFTNWLKSKDDIDSSKLNVMQIYKQHKKRKRIIATIAAKDKK